MRTVKDFGAKGNGKADDTAAIQRALNARVLNFPPGTYVFYKTLRVPRERKVKRRGL